MILSRPLKPIFNKRYPGIHHAIVKHYCTSILILIIFFAFILRYFQLHIGLPYLYFWDEPLTASNALQILKTGDYNPHFFKYGSLMIYLNLLIDQLYRIYLSLTGDLASVANIRIEADTGWHWTISHPGFYFWNRFLTATMGTATVFVTYFISKSICNRWTGIISALFLSVLPIHIVHSGFVTMDVPVALFVSLVALFSILFTNHKKPIYFLWSLICVGLAIATKYNSGLAILLPIASLIYLSYRDKIPAPKIVLASDTLSTGSDVSHHNALRNSRLPKFYQRHCTPNPLLQNHGPSRRNDQSRMGLYRVSDPTILPEHRTNRHPPICNRSGGNRLPPRIAPDLILPHKLPSVHERHDRQLSQKFYTGVPIHRHLRRGCVLQSACGIDALV